MGVRRSTNGSIVIHRRRRETIRQVTGWTVESLEVRRLLSGIMGFANFALNGADGTGSNGSSTANNNFGAAPVIVAANSDLTITSAANYEASSAWYNTPLPVQNFTASFTYEERFGTTPPADGITFTLQNDPRGAHAIAGGGGDLGYTSNSFVATPIAKSFAVEFNIYNTSQTSYAINGGAKLDAQTTGSVNLAGGDTINVSLSYNTASDILTEKLTDTTASPNTTYTTSFTGINLSALLGSNLAYVGFTGGTGGADAQQDITNFHYSGNGGFVGFTLNAANGAGIDGSAKQDNNNGAAPTLSAADQNTLTITTAAANQASSAFVSTAMPYQNFTASFTYQESGSSNPANGFAFVLEDDARKFNALGGGGADLGYGTDSTQPATPIGHSIAVEFNVAGVSSTGIGINATSGLPTGSSNTGSVNLRSGDPIKVVLSYNSSTLTETLSDTITNSTFSTSYSGLNLPAILNSNTGYVGFTGGTGAAVAAQTISNFLFEPNTSVPPPPPAGPVTGFANFTLNAANGLGLNNSSVSDVDPSGVPAVSTDQTTLTLTTTSFFEASSAIYNAPVPFQNFAANFTYTNTAGNGISVADGFTFVLQNDPRDVNAIGDGGGSLGYGNQIGDGATPISPSFSAQFNVYEASSVSIGTDGAVNIPYGVRNTGSVNLASGDPINVSLSYNSVANTLQETLTDTTNKATYTVLYTSVNLAATLGGTTARIGFTGGTGGGYSLQTISNFTFTTSNTVPPAPTLPPPVGSLTGFVNFNLDDANTNPTGVPAISSDLNTLTLSSAQATEASTAFSGVPVSYGNFTATFTYTTVGYISGGNIGAFTFALEDTPSLGSTAGGDLGYAAGNPNSFAVEFNVGPTGSIGIGAGGSLSFPQGISNTGSVNLDGGGAASQGDPIVVLLSYNGATQTLAVTLADTVTHATYFTTFGDLNLWRFLNGSPGTYVGFTGDGLADGSQQTISNFTYSASPSQPIADAIGSQVNLAGYFNAYAIENAGSPTINGGYDGDGESLLASYFGSSQTIDINGTEQTFDFGPAGAPDAITPAGQTINLPQGKYQSITIVGGAANGAKFNQQFTVTYTDGTNQTFTQSLSDWWYPGSTFPGEAVAIPMIDWVTANGTVGQPNSPLAVYDYTFAIDPSRTLQSITLANSSVSNAKILAVNLNLDPAVTSVNPNSGPAAGDTVVTINGTGFTGATAVDFGSTPATLFQVNATGTQITAVSPAGTGTVDVTVVAPYGTSPITPADQFLYTAALPAWLAPTSVATWSLSTHVLNVTGSATIIADPGTDEPNIVASGAAAKLAVTPSTSPTDVHIGGITLSNGASMSMTSVGSGRTHSNHNVLVLGKLGSASDPTLSVDATSKLDLSDNDLIVHTGTSDANGASAYAALIALAEKGRNPAGGAPGQPDGQWNGDGLTSSAAASADLSAGYEKIGLGIAVNSSILIGQYASWQVGAANETLGANDVIVKYDYLADYSLEGQVYQDDAGILQLEYDNGTSTGHTWATGSSLYDGLADNTEAGLMQLQYGLGTGGNNGPQL